jgi:hypothetical protein
MATLGTMSMDAGKMRRALRVKVTMKGMKPMKARVWLMVKLVSLARFVGGCHFEVVTAWDEDELRDAITVR